MRNAKLLRGAASANHLEAIQRSALQLSALLAALEYEPDAFCTMSEPRRGSFFELLTDLAGQVTEPIATMLEEGSHD